MLLVLGREGGGETWFITLSEKKRQLVLKSGLPIKIFGTTGQCRTVGCRTVHKELHDMYSTKYSTLG